MSAEIDALIKRNEELRAALAAETIKFIAAFTPAQATPVLSGTPPLEQPGVAWVGQRAESECVCGCNLRRYFTEQDT